MIFLAAFSLICAAVPALLFFANLRLYRPAPRRCAETPDISVLIPARDEGASIAGAVESVLANRNASFEIVVLDDHSTDATARIVGEIAARDPRVRLESAPPLPEGWCGKQHACHLLARHARHRILVFIDADVRLAPDALVRFAAFLDESGADLASGIPRQITGTFLERLMIPLIHFVLLGFLPLRRMRAHASQAYASGCGQLFIARRSAYEKAGGHAAIRGSAHDGLTLPKAFRRAGLRTDLFDATDTAQCRMYHDAREVWRGLGKNATEALASPMLIGPASIVLLGGQVLPWVMLAAPAIPRPAQVLAVAAAALTVLPRMLSALRFRQSWLGAMLHPLGVFLLVVIQWQAFLRNLLGRPAVWKGRSCRFEPAREAQ